MIGVFDSGVGGLTVVKEIFKYLPNYQLIYFGDTARLPYGTKGADFVKKYSAKITDWLLKKGAKIIVIACHTSSAWAADFLKNKFKGIPIFEVITPAASQTCAVTKNKKIGIIGTPGTIKSGTWNKKLLNLDSSLKIYSKACPLLVPLVEEGWVDGKITKQILEIYLREFKNRGVDTLILACTHYPILEKVIKEAVGERVKIINPAKSLAKELKLFLAAGAPAFVPLRGTSAGKSAGKHQFFFSDQPYNLEKISRLCLNQKIQPIIKDPF